jgi:uncharacterized membrane protein YphA (DoxX/SURF4 family)
MRSSGLGVRIVLLVLRVVVGLVFVGSGLQKFTSHARYADLFAHWHVPLAELSTYLNGVVEVGCGVLLIAGVVSRTAAAALLVDMVLAFLTAGLTDHGQYLVVPSVLAALCLLLALAGGGALQLLPTSSVIPYPLPGTRASRRGPTPQSP